MNAPGHPPTPTTVRGLGWLISMVVVAGVFAALTAGPAPEQPDPPPDQTAQPGLTTSTPAASAPSIVEAPTTAAPPPTSVPPPAAVPPPADPAGPSMLIAGRVMDGAGRPAAGIEVTAAEQIGVAEGLFFQTGIRETATTGSDGTYRIRVNRPPEEVMGLDFFVTAAGPDASTVVRTVVAQDPHGVPDLWLWGAGMTVEGGRARWRPAPASGDGNGVSYTLHVATEGSTITRAGDGAGASFDQRLIEDHGATASAVAAASANPAGQRGDGDVTYTTRAVELRGPGPPVSRGVACRLADDSGRSGDPNPCSLTNGTFDDKVRYHAPPGCPDEGDCGFEHATLDLGQTVAASLVVVRGCPFGCRVETSADGTTWAPLGEVEGELEALEPAGAAVRFVRLRASLFFVGELSVWHR